VKSLLLGSAAGLIAVAGAQAADLPVKAKAVEYVKICSLYGVGYYYIPGTDTCIKIGGYVRWEGYHNAPTGNYPNHTTAGSFDRGTNTFAMQARFRLTTDVRTQTEYGTLRSYFAFGVNTLNGNTGADATAPALAMERAFIQFAGFTIGRSDTFFAFYNGAAYGLVPLRFDGSTGPGGLNVFAYTWQFGNGLSASISLEDGIQMGAPVIDLNTSVSAIPPLGAPGGGLPAALGFGTQTGDDRIGSFVPNIVANLRVDQAWGSAQIMGALHEVGGRYNRGIPGGCTPSNFTGCPHPDNEWGWAVGGGLTLKMPWDAKDTLSGVIAYSEGAGAYVASLQNNNFIHKQGIAIGQFTDGVFARPGHIPGYDGSVELTKTWGGTIAFEHYWTPSLRTAWVAGYMSVEYSDTAKAIMAAAHQQVPAAFGACGGALFGAATLTNVTNCNPDWSSYRLASRTMWNPVANLDVGLEVAYTKVNTAYAGAAILQFPVQNVATGTYNIEDQSFWTATVRVQRSFWP